MPQDGSFGVDMMRVESESAGAFVSKRELVLQVNKGKVFQAVLMKSVKMMKKEEERSLWDCKQVYWF
ncbi:hypothetical protein V2J09_003546 [Rumex salicifolius]